MSTGASDGVCMPLLQWPREGVKAAAQQAAAGGGSLAHVRAKPRKRIKAEEDDALDGEEDYEPAARWALLCPLLYLCPFSTYAQ